MAILFAALRKYLTSVEALSRLSKIFAKLDEKYISATAACDNNRGLLIHYFTIVFAKVTKANNIPYRNHNKWVP